MILTFNILAFYVDAESQQKHFNIDFKIFDILSTVVCS